MWEENFSNQFWAHAPPWTPVQAHHHREHGGIGTELQLTEILITGHDHVDQDDTASCWSCGYLAPTPDV